jgi:hypothetical protein
VARHFASAAQLLPFVLSLNANSSMSRTLKTKWMAAAFQRLATKFPECRNRQILDGKSTEVICNDCIANPSKEKEKELVFDTPNMVKAVCHLSVEEAQQQRRFHGDEPMWHIWAHL